MPTNRGLVKKTKGIWTYNTRVILKNEEYFYTNMGGKIPKLYVRLSSKKKKKGNYSMEYKTCCYFL